MNSDETHIPPQPRLTLRDGETGDSALPTFYDEIGGHDVFEGIVNRFYDAVQTDTILFEMYPKDDVSGAKQRLCMFLEQYWGGPATYSELRGHPRLRMRHQPFHINPDARDRWLTHMTAAVQAAKLPPIHEATMLDYLDRAAHAMVNTFD